MFTRMLQQARRTPAQFTELAGELFQVMAAGGRVGFEAVAWFNGGLFDDGAALPLEAADLETVLAASDLDWSEISPSSDVWLRTVASLSKATQRVVPSMSPVTKHASGSGCRPTRTAKRTPTF